MNGATPHWRSPTSYCATRSASPTFTTPSPFTSPHRVGLVVVVVLVDVLDVVVVDEVVVNEVVEAVVVVVGALVVVVLVVLDVVGG